jgi:hypothetical protein
MSTEPSTAVVVRQHQTPQHTFADLERMAVAVAASKLFGVRTKEEALSLMLLAQAEGRHPAIAALDYHIIEGRPALKADAMLARFQEAGGRVEWHELGDTKASATFSHPTGGTHKIEWTIESAKMAGLVRNNSNGSPGMWMKYPRAMLRSRVVSEGVRTILPGVIVGTYTPEEVRDGEAEMRDVVSVQEVKETPAAPAEAPSTATDPVVVDGATGEILEQPQTAAAAQILPENQVKDLELSISAASTLRDLQKAHAVAYKAAFAEHDTVALRRFEKAKDTRKAQLTEAAA